VIIFWENIFSVNSNTKNRRGKGSNFILSS
jgi:hypothetical protein